MAAVLSGRCVYLTSRVSDFTRATPTGLYSVLKRLRDIGNTVVIVEHDEEIIREADHLIDVGSEAGRNGGRIVNEGSPASLPDVEGSYTAAYLNGRMSILCRRTDAACAIL